MNTRKNLRAKRAALSVQEKDENPSVRRLTADEAKACFSAAAAANRVHQPMCLRSMWDQRKRGENPQAVAELVRIMRSGLNTPEIDDPVEAPKYLARLIHLVVTRFERLVIGGVLDDVLPRLDSLPLLYSVTAGNGAAKWIWARKLFKAKQVGEDASVLHGRSVDLCEKRTLQWRSLAEDAVAVARDASLEIAHFDELRRRAVASWPFAFKRVRAHYGLFGTLYLLDDDSVLIWPDWLEKCRGLPVKVKADVIRYKAVSLALAQEFFGGPYNKYADELLEPLLKSAKKHGQTAGRARMEAALMVAAAVGRLGGEK